MSKIVMEQIAELTPRDVRLQGLIDLELGGDSRWMLIIKDDNNSPRLIVPTPSRVSFSEVMYNLRNVADAIEQIVITKAKAEGK